METTQQTQAAAETKKRANSVYVYRKIDGLHEWDYGPTLGKFTVDPAKISASARDFLLGYGITQWINDGAAKMAGADGKVDPAAKFNGSRARAELLNQGTEAGQLLRRGDGAGAFSYVTRALVRIGTYAGQDVSTYDKANAYVKGLADSTKPEVVKYGFKGQVGRVRDWLERNSKTIAKAIDEIRAEEAAAQPAVDADAELEGLVG